jgi:putative flippase GtrA
MEGESQLVPGARHGSREVRTLFRASISSGLATAADGIAYQMLLLFFTGSYGVAAFVGALLGGVTNFGINRRWVFGTTSKRLRFQALEYALTCLLTYAALQTFLFVFIEIFRMGMHGAWVPAKILAWLLVSYPVQRFLVFSAPRRIVETVDPEPVSEHPPMAV